MRAQCLSPPRVGPGSPRCGYAPGAHLLWGPIAHLGYFHAEYGCAVAGSMSKPTPIWWPCVSSCRAREQPGGLAVGIFRAGLLGGLMAWLSTPPSALALVASPTGYKPWAVLRRMAAWPQGGRSRRGGAGCLGYGPEFDARPPACHPRRPRRRRHAGLAHGLGQVLIIAAAGLLYHRMTLTGVQGPSVALSKYPHRCACRSVAASPSVPGSSWLGSCWAYRSCATWPPVSPWRCSIVSFESALWSLAVATWCCH